MENDKEKLEELKVEAKTLYANGARKFITSFYEDAIKYFENCLKIISFNKLSGLEDIVANSLEYLGQCFWNKADKYFDKAEENFYFGKDNGFDDYNKAIEDYKLAINYLSEAKKRFNELLDRDSTNRLFKTYIRRCEDVSNICSRQIEICEERIELVK